VAITKKVFVANPNVGSAIEYMGNILCDWLSDLDVSVYDYKHQTRFTHTLKHLHEFEPDLIILNEYYFRLAAAALGYQRLFDTPLVHVDHVWKRLNKTTRDCSEGLQEYEIYNELRQYSHHVFCLNYKPEGVSWHKDIRGRVSNRYYATDPNLFSVSKPWSERDKMFCYIGNMIPHKLSSDFLAKVTDTDLVVDCYGSLKEEGQYNLTFDRAVEHGNINYYGLVPQLEVPAVMNEYKYLVLPHNGYEPFNWVVKQCLHCGTIPLITNNRSSTHYDPTWIDWAQGMYMGCEYTSEFLENLEQLDDERPDHSGMSEHLSQEVRRRFPYQEFKDEFLEKVRELLYG